MRWSRPPGSVLGARHQDRWQCVLELDDLIISHRCPLQIDALQFGQRDERSEIGHGLTAQPEILEECELGERSEVADRGIRQGFNDVSARNPASGEASAHFGLAPVLVGTVRLAGVGLGTGLVLSLLHTENVATVTGPDTPPP